MRGHESCRKLHSRKLHLVAFRVANIGLQSFKVLGYNALAKITTFDQLQQFVLLSTNVVDISD